MHIQNAIISSVSLSKADHNLLSAWLMLDYGDSGHQGFGGFSLYLPKDFLHHGGRNYAGHFIFRCLEIGGVDDWDQLKGKSIRVKLTQEGLGGKIIAIGHITKNDWFDPEQEFKTIPV